PVVTPRARCRRAPGSRARWTSGRCPPCSRTGGPTTCASPATIRTTTRPIPAPSTRCGHAGSVPSWSARCSARTRSGSTAKGSGGFFGADGRGAARFEALADPARDRPVVPALDGERRGVGDGREDEDQHEAHEVVALEDRLRELPGGEDLCREQRAQHEHRCPPPSELRGAEQGERGCEVP